jgi:hypothetical protein
MMTDAQLANVLQVLVVAFFWSILVFKILPEARLDAFRQKMFGIRDEMFDYAADGNIPFDHPAYVLLRRQMNGFIRYGHQLTVYRCLMTAAIHRVSGRPMQGLWFSEWMKAMDSLENDSVRKSLENFHNKGMMLAIKRLLFGSPLLWVITLIFMVEMMGQGAAMGTKQLVKAASKRALTGPINQRLIEETAQGEFA